MSYDTYISILSTSLVAIAIGVIGVLCPLIFSDNNVERKIDRGKKNKGNKIIEFPHKKVNRRLTMIYKIFFIFICLTVLFIITTTIIYEISKPNTYDQTINKAEFELDNHNYIEAAKFYNEAAYVAYNIETKVTALYCEGACYLELGLYSDDDIYFSQALNKYYLILNNEKFKDTEYYQDALIDSSFALRELYDRWNDENLTNIIYYLENAYDFSSIEDIPLDKVDLMNKVALALAEYYKYAVNENYKIGNKNMIRELSNKAIYYYGIVFQLYPRVDIIHHKNTNLLVLYLEVSELMIKQTMASTDYNDAVTKINTTIKLCKSAINEFKLSEADADVLSAYLRLKINIGKLYYLLSIEDDKYLSEAYDELRPLLYISVDDDIEPTLLDAGYYLILTKKCTEEDLDKILDRYVMQIEGMTINDENYLTIVQSALEACNFIVEYYEENNRALKLGEEFSMKVDNVLSVYKK